MGEQKLSIEDALSREHLLKKKLAQAAADATKYSARKSSDAILFGGVEQHKAAVHGTWDSARDLLKEITALRRRIRITNDQTIVETRLGPLSLGQILDVLREHGKMAAAPIDASDNAYEALRRGFRAGQEYGGSPVVVEPMYDEAVRRKLAADWVEIMIDLDKQLKKANHETTIVD